MKKIILTKDIKLNKLAVDAGSDGYLIVQQDDRGGHLVTLPAGDGGFADVALNPHAVTEIHWSKDDVTTYWSAVKMTSDVTINEPSAIYNLTVEIVDTVSAKLRFNAPQGFIGSDASSVDLYYLVIGTSPLLPDADYSGIRLPIIPNKPNIPEAYIIPNLLSGKRYYAGIYSEKVAFGKIRKSQISNTVTFFTTTAEGTVPRRIPLKYNNIYEPLVVVAFPEGQFYNNIPSFRRLAVQPHIIDNNGVPAVVGTAPYSPTSSYQSWGVYQPSWYNLGSYKVFFELDGTYDLDYVYLNTNYRGRIKLYTSADGVNLIEGFDSGLTSFNRDTLARLDLSAPAKPNVKYLILAFDTGSGDVAAIVPYGTRKTAKVVTGIKYKALPNTKTFVDRVGTNAFLSEQQFSWIGKVSSTLRTYVLPDWILHGSWRLTGFAIGKTPDDIEMNAASHVWDFDAKLQELLNTGQKEILFCVKENFQVLRATTVLDNAAQYKIKSVDPDVNYRDITKTTDPQSYKFLARIFASMAYRWGFNQNAPEVCNQFVDNPERKGLGLVRYFEVGNEFDKWWDGLDGFMNPHEQAAMLSACYDGHKGALGAGFGIKSADPSAKLVMAGLIGINWSFVREMIKWWDANRGLGDYPIDIINFHHYNGYRGATDVPVYSNVPAYAIPPEKGHLIEDTNAMLRVRNVFAPNQQVWITEFGSDENNGGIYSPRDNTKALRGRHKALWILRSTLVYLSLGVDSAIQYWYAGDSNRVEDLPNEQINREIFLTSGLVDGVTSAGDRNRKPLQSWWYVVAFRKAMKGYKYLHTIVEAGETKVVENDIILNYHPDLWAMAFQHETTGAKIIVAWLGVDNWIDFNLQLKVNNEVNILPTLDFLNQDVRQSETGVTTNVTPVVSGASKYVNLNISESPLIIFSELVGNAKFIAPEDIEIQSLSSDAVKIAWTDKNISSSNKIRVYQSSLPDAGFVIVKEQYQDNAEIVVNGLLPETPYYFKIQFVEGARISEISDVLSVTTQYILPEPTALVQDNATVSSSAIKVAWTYPTLLEAKTEAFVIYRSNTINGTYNEVGRVAKTLRTFTDTGLISSSLYYYKVRATKDDIISGYSSLATASTISLSATPPAIQTATTDTTGSIIELAFDFELKDEQTALSAFTLVEKLAGNFQITHHIQSIAVLDDRRKLQLKIDRNIFKNSTLTISYDAAFGALTSLTNVDVNTFVNFAVTVAVTDLFTPMVDWADALGIGFNRNTLTSIAQARAVAKQKIGIGESAIVQFNTELADSFLVGLDAGFAPEGFTTFDYYLAKIGGVVSVKKLATFTTTNTVFDKGILRFRTNGVFIFFEVSYDMGVSFTTITTSPQPSYDLYIKVYTGGAGTRLLNIVGKGLTGTSLVITPDAPTNMVIDDTANTVGFTLNPQYPITEHEYTTHYGVSAPIWNRVPSNPILIGDVMIPAGDFAIRVREGTDRTASEPLVSTIEMIGNINASAKIFVQRSNGGTVLFSTNDLDELKTWLASAVITQDITVQFNTSDTYYLNGSFGPNYNNGTNWVTFQGAAGVRPIFDAQHTDRTVWYINKPYTILRNMELKNANINIDSGCIIRGDTQHHMKILDMILDYGWCGMRATPDGGTRMDNLEVDNVIVRNVLAGAFRCNGVRNFPNANISYRNIWLDDVANGGVISGATWGDGKFSAPLVLKMMDGVTVDGYRHLNSDRVAHDAGETEGCGIVHVKNVSGVCFLFKDCATLTVENCYLPWETGAKYNNVITNCGNITILHSYIAYCNGSGSYNVLKLKGNIFKMSEKDSFWLQLENPASMPLEESDNIFIGGYQSDQTYKFFYYSFRDGSPAFVLTSSNLASYKATGKGNNSKYLPYEQRDQVNVNPWGSLRENSVGKRMITGVIEGISEDIFRNNRVYPTDPGPFNGLRTDENDTATPPTVTGDDTLRTLIASHPKYAVSEIVYSYADGAYQPYTGVINVGDLAVAVGVYKFKIKAGAYRNESSVVNSPAFLEKPPVGSDYEVLQTIEVNFSSTSCDFDGLNKFNAQDASLPALINTDDVTTGIGIAAYVPFEAVGCDLMIDRPDGEYIRKSTLIRSGARARSDVHSTLQITGLDATKFYQFYIISGNDSGGDSIKITIGDMNITKTTSSNYPLTINGDMYINPAVIRFPNRVSDEGSIFIEFEKMGTAWPVALNYLIIEESNVAKPV